MLFITRFHHIYLFFFLFFATCRFGWSVSACLSSCHFSSTSICWKINNISRKAYLGIQFFSHASALVYSLVHLIIFQEFFFATIFYLPINFLFNFYVFVADWLRRAENFIKNTFFGVLIFQLIHEKNEKKQWKYHTFVFHFKLTKNAEIFAFS